MNEKEEPAITMEPETFRSYFVAEQKALKNGDVEAYISTEAVDRMGDIIKAKGWELESFKKSGSPVLFAHEYGIAFSGVIPHIGNAIEIEIQRKGLWSVTRFHEKTQLSREAAIMAREHILPSWSVGFRALEKPEDRMVEGEWKGFIFNKQELLEYSLVPVPANPEARSKAEHLVRKGLISRRTARELAAAPVVDLSALPDTGNAEDERALSEFRREHQNFVISSGFHRG